MAVPSPQIAALRSKYVEIQRMREEHDSGTAVDPRADMRALAARFPGALRELDDLTRDELDARIRALDEALQDPSALPRWAELLVAYHGWMRAALRIKRLIACAPDAAAAHALVHAPYTAAPDEPELSRWDADRVREVRRPPGGRLHPWIVTQLAADHSLDPTVVTTTLFPRRRKHPPK